MADLPYPQQINRSEAGAGRLNLRLMLTLGLGLLVAVVAIWLGLTYRSLPDDAPAFSDSTLAQLALWMADQSTLEAPVALLGQYARSWALQSGADSLDVGILYTAMRNMVALWCWAVAGLILLGLVAVIRQSAWSRSLLLPGLVGLLLLIFNVPPLEGDPTQALLLGAILILLIVMLLAPGGISKVMGFFVVLACLLVAWETMKAFAASVNFAITVPVGELSYTAYPTLEDSLAALRAGETAAFLGEQRDLRDLVPPSPLGDEDAASFAYPDLRLLRRMQTDAFILGLPIRPALSGRLAVIVPAGAAEGWTSPNDFGTQQLGVIQGDFAEERYLLAPREWVLLDLKIFNDLNLPHLQSIAGAFTQPARRNGPVLLVNILWNAGLYTWLEALYGFVSGALLGFGLGTLFAHSRLMERGLLPYVIASQTVPILAIAPMVVIWLGAGPQAVAVIAAYITFFPVTINTLRGLRSPDPMALELMHSYAASTWTIMWKLRFPAALPYIFTALKVSATASVVGAIIGELPSSIRDGLGRAILDFSSDYSLISTPKLWAAIIMAAFVGISFFLIVTLIERIALRAYVRSA